MMTLDPIDGSVVYEVPAECFQVSDGPHGATQFQFKAIIDILDLHPLNMHLCYRIQARQSHFHTFPIMSLHVLPFL